MVQHNIKHYIMIAAYQTVHVTGLFIRHIVIPAVQFGNRLFISNMDLLLIIIRVIETTRLQCFVLIKCRSIKSHSNLKALFTNLIVNLIYIYIYHTILTSTDFNYIAFICRTVWCRINHITRIYPTLLNYYIGFQTLNLFLQMIQGT